MRNDRTDADAFIEAASVPLGTSHASGTLDDANAMLAARPDLARLTIHAAAVGGDDEAVRRFIAADPAGAIATGGPRGWNALTYLCFSRYLRLDRSRSGAFVRAATALLDAGADPNSAWFDETHQPTPERESVLYGAAGIAHDGALTRLLLERGADPNDEETPYHAPETYDHDALRALVESGKLSDDSVATLLLRKTDWHDYDGIDYLLAHGADPNRRTRFGGRTALHHALLRDNDIEILGLLIDRGADPAARSDEGTAVAIAARRGRADFLDALQRRGAPPELDGIDALFAACATGHDVRGSLKAQSGLAAALAAQGGRALAEFAGNGNTQGVGRLLDAGVPVTAPFEQGDGYWGIAPQSSALHVAAWRARHDTVSLLIARGAAVDARDKRGRTPLALAVKACVDSYWSGRRSPESVAALLAAGAKTDDVTFPSGYDPVDDLLRAAGMR